MCAYGQTGSGKTFTMNGTIGNSGVISRTVDLLVDFIKAYRNLGWQYQIKGQYLEIYNEVLYDVLDNESKAMEIRMTRSDKNGVYISNITQETVKNADCSRQLMRIAKTNHATAATAGNERSSRFHAVICIELIGSHAEKRGTSNGSINLVDLPGSESLKTSMRLNETKNINRSLSELTNFLIKYFFFQVDHHSPSDQETPPSRSWLQIFQLNPLSMSEIRKLTYYMVVSHFQTDNRTSVALNQFSAYG
uniref:Kinesin motor domain-containing protein n=1 Tax=Glossina pallidipes TaxID=7398 RepID=A0A1B0AF87_GLOPL